MTLDEIAYNILNLVRGGKTHHDETISLSQIKFNIKYYRAMLLRRDFARNGLVTRHVEQNLGCVKLIKVDASKCCNLPIDCHVMRTEVKLPRTVRFNFEDAITYVGAIDGITRIPMAQSHMIKYLMWDKYTGKNTKAYMIDDYLYLYEPHEISLVNVRGVFEDPEELSKFDCESGECYNDTADFPLPADMIQVITQGIVQGELGLLASTPSDLELDRHQAQAPPPNIPRSSPNKPQE